CRLRSCRRRLPEPWRSATWQPPSDQRLCRPMSAPEKGRRCIPLHPMVDPPKLASHTDLEATTAQYAVYCRPLQILPATTAGEQPNPTAPSPRRGPFVASAQQEDRLLAEQIPEPPRCVEPQRAAPGIERTRPFHLGADRVAQIAKVLDGAEMDVRRVVP